VVLPDALIGQYRAGFAMLRSCIELCPDDLWIEGEHPRTFWRIVYHAIQGTHHYLMPTTGDYQPWERGVWHGFILWDDDEDGMPPVEHPYTQADLLDYLAILEANVEPWVKILDLESPESGFEWYPIPKIDHQIVNIRHLGVHIGQLQERLYTRGIEPIWAGKR
jgi:hypothetical protein